MNTGMKNDKAFKQLPEQSNVPQSLSTRIIRPDQCKNYYEIDDMDKASKQLPEEMNASKSTRIRPDFSLPDYRGIIFNSKSFNVKPVVTTNPPYSIMCFILQASKPTYTGSV